MARGDDRPSTDDLTGRREESRGAPAPAGGDIREVRTEGGQVHVERESPAEGGAPGRSAEAGAGGAAAVGDERRPLLREGELDEFRRRWEEVQSTFVDEPRRAVEEADALVAGVMQRLADSFSAERQDLEGRWDRGDDVDTESLRVALQRYRSFFNRLLST